MEQSEFDKFADEYRQLHDKNIRLSGERGDYFAKYKIAGDVIENLVDDLQKGSKECWSPPFSPN